MAEVHVIGRLVGASGFRSQDLFCVWELHLNSGWKLISGLKKGQTQVDLPEYEDFAQWSHPIDIHLATKGVQGWPKLDFHVYHLDKFGRSELWSYGFCHLPTSPGTHKIEVGTWRPLGPWSDQARHYFLGGGPELKNHSMVYTGVDRFRLRTEAMGKVHLELGIIFRNFDRFGVEY